MREILIRCSSLGKLMTDPTAAAIKAGEILSVGAKSAVRDLAAQDILGMVFEVDAKQMAKGIRLEEDAIALLNRLRGLSLVKNTERRNNGFITGECDLFDADRKRGHDLKCAWSGATFPILAEDIGGSQRTAYEWQARGYMALWDADEWEVNFALLDTPEDLIGWESAAMHFVGHIPEHMRLTTWTIKRDATLEAKMAEKVKAARDYYAFVLAEFERTHSRDEALKARILERSPAIQAALP
jgi:hypothetical protein